jgi:hypothetical protein
MKIDIIKLYILEYIYQRTRDEPHHWYTGCLERCYGVPRLFTNRYSKKLYNLISKNKKISRYCGKKLLNKYLKYEKLGRTNSKFFRRNAALYFQSRENFHGMIRFDNFRA